MQKFWIAYFDFENGTFAFRLNSATLGLKMMHFDGAHEQASTKADIPNINALNSDTQALRIQYEYTQKQCVGVAIGGMDIWYMGLTSTLETDIGDSFRW